MTKNKILTIALMLLCVASCKKNNPTTLTGSQWGTTIQQIQVLLTFTDASKGVLKVTNPEGDPMVTTIDFTYTFSDPVVILMPTNPEYAVDYPSGIRATVHDKVMDISEFFPGMGDVSLTKK